MSEHIDPEEVNKAFYDCLYRPEEATGDKPPENAVTVEGILTKGDFNSRRLESHRERVVSWLKLLPTEFRKSGGGGWSFLQACNEADGYQWTGLHQRMEQLFMLGIALGAVEWCLPREMWSILPAGMPYVCVKL